MTFWGGDRDRDGDGDGDGTGQDGWTDGRTNIWTDRLFSENVILDTPRKICLLRNVKKITF